MTECFDCERSKRRMCQMGAGAVGKPLVMVIGSYPEEEAAINDIHFYHENRMLLDNMLNKYVGINQSHVVYTYASKCRMRGYDKGPTLNEIRACRRHTWEEIKQYRPRLIIAMGKEAMALFRDTYNGIKFIRGTGEIYTDNEIGSVTVCYTRGWDVFMLKRPTSDKSEDWKRDERRLIYSDFEWIGKVLRDPAMLNPRQATKFKTHYLIMKKTDPIEKYKKAFDYIYDHHKGIISYDFETRSIENKTATCVGIGVVPGRSIVFPVLNKRIPNIDKMNFYKNSIKTDANGAPLKDDKGEVLTNLVKKNGEISKRGEMYKAMPAYLGDEYHIENDEVREYVHSRLVDLLTDERIPKVTQNGIFDAHAFRFNYKLDVRGWTDDVMHMHSMIDEESIRGLKALADLYLPRLRGYDTPLHLYMEKNKIKDWINIPYEVQGVYNAQDADATLTLYWMFKNMITQAGDWDFYKRYAMRLQEIMYGVEKRGIYLDNEFLESKSEELIAKMKGWALSMVDFVSKCGLKKFAKLSPDNIDPTTGKMDRYTEGCEKGFKVEGNDDVATVLLKAGVKLTDKTKDGRYVQSGAVLKKYKDDSRVSKFVDDVLEYRLASKKNSFLMDYMNKLQGSDRLYSSFTVHGAVTGRFTCKEPNLQQIPRDSDVKNVVIAPPGFKLVQADLSQAELRILAHYADETSMKQVFKGVKAICAGSAQGYIYLKDKTPGDLSFFFAIQNKRDGSYYCVQAVPDRDDLLYIIGRLEASQKAQNAFKIASDAAGGNNWVHPMEKAEIGAVFTPGTPLDTGSGDIHMFVGSQIHDKIIWQLDKEERSVAKSTSFGIPYGISAFALGIQIGKTTEEAEELINLVFKKFPKVKKYIDDTILESQVSAQKNNGIGIVRTELGRKRHLSDVMDMDPKRRSHTRRQAVNFKIQATCHDLMVNHIIAVEEEIKKRESGARIVNQVHDSLLLYCPDDELKDFLSWLKPTMEKPYLNSDLEFPADVEVYEKCWGGKKLKSI